MDHVLGGRAAESPVGRASQADPVRRVVHAMLVFYLSPVILVVLLIGGVAIAGGKLAAVGGRCLGGLARLSTPPRADAGMSTATSGRDDPEGRRDG